MRQKREKHWLGKMFLTGLFAAAVMSTPGTDPTAAEGIPVKKSGFMLTEFVAAEVARLQPPEQAGSPSEAGKSSSWGRPDESGIESLFPEPEKRYDCGRARQFARHFRSFDIREYCDRG